MEDGRGDSGSPVRSAVRGQLLVITIDRPQVRNAIDGRTARELAAAFDRLESTAALRAGVLTGAGGYFCAGADLRARLADERVRDDHGLAGLTRRRRTKPLIAAVEGGAVGGGLELALACDLVVSDEAASFAFPEVRRGVMAAEGGLVRAVARLGRGVAMEMALTGESMTAERAWGLGLVNRLAPTGGALDAAVALADVLLGHGEAVVAETLRVVAALAERMEMDEQAWSMVDAAYRRVRASGQHGRAIDDFLGGGSR